MPRKRIEPKLRLATLTDEDIKIISELLDTKLLRITHELYGVTGTNGMKGDIKRLQEEVKSVELSVNTEISDFKAFVTGAKIYFALGSAIGALLLGAVIVLLFSVLTHKVPPIT